MALKNPLLHLPAELRVSVGSNLSMMELFRLRNTNQDLKHFVDYHAHHLMRPIINFHTDRIKTQYSHLLHCSQLNFPAAFTLFHNHYGSPIGTTCDDLVKKLVAHWVDYRGQKVQGFTIHERLHEDLEYVLNCVWKRIDIDDVTADAAEFRFIWYYGHTTFFSDLIMNTGDAGFAGFADAVAYVYDDDDTAFTFPRLALPSGSIGSNADRGFDLSGTSLRALGITSLVPQSNNGLNIPYEDSPFSICLSDELLFHAVNRITHGENIEGKAFVIAAALENMYIY